MPQRKQNPQSTYMRIFLTAILIATAFHTQTAQSQAQPKPQTPGEPASAGGPPTPEQESIRPTLDLGNFKINDLRPTRNETAKLTFKLHLVFSEKLSKAQATQLESWKHRLRDQVITAIRITPTKDFQQPDLSHMRRKILIRVNRLFHAKLAEEVLMTEYLFRTH